MPASLDRVKRKGRAAVARRFASLERLTITYVPIDSVRPNSYNPNRQSQHELELLLRSIEDNGFTQPIMVRRDTNEIVDGYHRWTAAGMLGLTEVPVVYVDHDDVQARIATLGMNRARGSEEVELTAALMRDLQALGALDTVSDSLLLGDDEIRLLIDNVSAPDVLAGDDFSAAWEPNRSSDDHIADGGATSMTDGGGAAIRAREDALRAARTEQEREQARKDNRVYRVSLVFSGPEADVVQTVLGDRPAVAIVALCQQEQARTAHADAAAP